MTTLMGLGAEAPGGFMSDATKIVSTIASGVTAGVIPKDKVESAVNFAVDLWARSRGITTPTSPDVPPPVYQPPPPPVVKAGIGAGTLAVLGIGGYLLLSKRKARRRPARRRRR